MQRRSYGKSAGGVLVCAYCKRILKGEAAWEKSAGTHGMAEGHWVSHGICPDCLLENFPDQYLTIQEEERVRMKNVFKKGFAELYAHLAK